MARINDRVNVVFKAAFDSLDDVEQTTTQWRDAVIDAGNEEFDTVQPLLLSDIRTYPPPRPNSKYVRTFRLQRGWNVQTEEYADALTAVTENQVPYTRYVMGDLVTNMDAAAEWQQQYHAETGWRLGIRIVDYYMQWWIRTTTERVMRWLKGEQ